MMTESARARTRAHGDGGEQIESLTRNVYVFEVQIAEKATQPQQNVANRRNDDDESATRETSTYR